MAPKGTKVEITATEARALAEKNGASKLEFQANEALLAVMVQISAAAKVGKTSLRVEIPATLHPSAREDVRKVLTAKGFHVTAIGHEAIIEF
jgi:hypothetical protein